ncbi:leucyl aminopeptidase [Mycetocola tolaasinivorans]|uniref:Probable cytosol aminopeptidase n=1 Tax=Mycetocola tolaasinivorans TaxID=76635 RepID=A0A3L7ABD3_9MICO|nr:leucyl aminopeptidase [Mycetocola tolaasinivorans]RLP77537.1 leucyl aminopeptidase [Mycetocola tolaasinivorans]
MTRTPTKLIADSFTPVPSLSQEPALSVTASLSGEEEVLGVLVAADSALPEGLDLDQEALTLLGFDGSAGSTVVLAGTSNPLYVLVGIGPLDDLNDAGLRTAAAALVRAVPHASALAISATSLAEVRPESAGQALAEGAILGRYRFRGFTGDAGDSPLESFVIEVPGANTGTLAALERGVAEGLITARATNIARDVINVPPGHLTPTNLGEVAQELAAQFGFTVEIFDEADLIALGCGGVLGVGAGSVEESRIIRLDYAPEAPTTAHLGLVGKGITYDSGGISLKPSDPMHLLMKMDMGGAGAVLATFTALRDLGVTARVTGWLACAENMPSGTAYKLGDVLTARGGKTVEVKNTDAEGRLVMMDALVLATEEGVDAIVDIATLTGAALRTFGSLIAAQLGNNEGFSREVADAAARADERIWPLPLEPSYRKQLDSDVADISNLGGPDAGSITAALFLNEFVAGTPWVHLDIAGTMQSDADDGWRSKGATGFGTRLLIETARNFRPRS